MRHLKLVVEEPQVAFNALAVSRISTFSAEKVTGEFDALPLHARLVQEAKAEIKKHATAIWLLVLITHVAMLACMLLLQPESLEKKEEPKPMLVSLVSNPAPEPELVPLVPPPPEVKQKPVEKKIVKKVEKRLPEPVPQIQEQVAEQQVVQEVPQEVVQETKAANIEMPKAVAKEEPKPAEPEPVVEPPRFGVAYLNNPAPGYPSMSRRLGEEGRVLLRVLVAKDGKAESVELEQTSGFERLDQSAIDVVKKWSFIPAKKGKETISAYVLVPVKFTLH